MPLVTCTCGTEFTAARANAKYCSDRCRKRTKRSGADVVPLTEAELKPEQADGRKPGAIESATHRELEQAGRVETMLGQTALAHARKMDHGFMETGSAFASLSKELRSVMADALRGTAAATAPQQLQDELAARRAERAG
mgnify:FL=1